MPQVNRTDFKNMVHMANGGTFTVPIGVSKITVIGSGGGGGGGGGGGTNLGGPTGSGAYGGFAIGSAVEMDVIPGEILTATVGNGGTGGTGGANNAAGTAGSNGTTSTISRGSTTIISFPAGAGGAGGPAGSNGTSGIPATIGFNVLTQSNTYGSSTYNTGSTQVDVSGLGYLNFSRSGGAGGLGAPFTTPTPGGPSGNPGQRFIANSAGGAGGALSGGGGGGGAGFIIIAW